MDPQPQSSGWPGLLRFVSVGGVASLGVSAVLFQLVSYQDGRIFTLDRAQTLETIAGVSRLHSMLPLLVAVRGRLTSSEPCKCEMADTPPAVMRELVEEEVYFKEHRNGRTTMECFELRREQEQREAFLEDRTGAVKLDHLQHAKGLTAVMDVKQVFHHADLLKAPLIEHILNKTLKSMVKQGTRVTERFLPVDTTVTIVGELVPDNLGSPQPTAARQQQPATQANGAAKAGAAGAGQDGAAAEAAAARRASGQGAGSSGRRDAAAEVKNHGSLSGSLADLGSELLGQAAVAAGGAALRAVLPYTLRMPAGGGPFHVTTLTLPQLRAGMERTSRTLRTFAWGFGVLGAALVARRVLAQLWRDREQRRLKRMLADAENARRQRLRAAAGATASTGADAAGGGAGGGGGCGGADEYDESRGPGVCVVCLDRDTEVVYSGCGHMATCVDCTASLRRCPICRVNSRPIRVFRS